VDAPRNYVSAGVLRFGGYQQEQAVQFKPYNMESPWAKLFGVITPPPKPDSEAAIVG